MPLTCTCMTEQGTWRMPADRTSPAPQAHLGPGAETAPAGAVIGNGSNKAQTSEAPGYKCETRRLTCVIFRPSARGRRVKYLLFAGVLAFTGQSQAQQVHKCVKGKEVSYQSEPCAEMHQTKKQWDATPEPPPTNAELWRSYYARKKGERDSAYLRSLAGRGGGGSAASIPSNNGNNACAAAKSNRQAALDAAGMSRTHDFLRSLDEMVYQACK